MSIQYATRPRAIGPDREVLSHAAALMAAVIFAGVGLVLVALGSALPLSLLVVENQQIPVISNDLALARQLAPMWPGFVAAGVASFVAAFGILDRGMLGKSIAIVVAGSGVALATAAQVTLFADGSAAAVATGVATTFLVALIAALIVERR